MNPMFRTGPLFALLLSVYLTACSNDYLEMSTEFKSELCVVKNNIGKPVSLLTDKGNVLNPISELDSNQFKPGNRYLVTYIVLDSSSLSSSNQVLGACYIRVKEMQYVSIKPVLRADQLSQPEEDGDPVNVLSQPWLGGGYLNMELIIRHENENIKHSLWMVADTTSTENGSLNTYLTLVHDANGDNQTKTVSNLVSFDCANLPFLNESDSLIIRFVQWDSNNRPVQNQIRIPNTAKGKLTIRRY